QRLHRVVEFAGLGAVALVYEDKDLALGAVILGKVTSDVREEGVNVTFLRCAELVDERADQPFVAGVEHAHQLRAAPSATDVLIYALEHLLDLVIQFGAVSDDQHARIPYVLAEPFREPDHHKALAAALGVPEDAALTSLRALL